MKPEAFRNIFFQNEKTDMQISVSLQLILKIFLLFVLINFFFLLLGFLFINLLIGGLLGLLFSIFICPLAALYFIKKQENKPNE
jgi:hypothetical protein